MPSEFIPVQPLSGAVSVYDVSANITRTDDQINTDLAKIVANGTINGTLTLGDYVPDYIGMSLATDLIALGWTISATGPIITQQPVFTVNVDGTWKLVIATSGSGTTYLWQWFDPNDGWTDTVETDVTYNNPPRNETSAIEPSIQRFYRCAVTRGGITAYTTKLVVNVPQISQQPSGATLTVGDTYTDVCIGFGDGTQVWTKDGVDIDLTGENIEIDNVSVGDAGTYRSVLTMSNGAKIVSDAAVVTVSE